MCTDYDVWLEHGEWVVASWYGRRFPRYFPDAYEAMRFADTESAKPD